MRACRVDPYPAIGNAQAFAVGNAPIPKGINIGSLPLFEKNTSQGPRRKTQREKQNEFPRHRSTINFSPEDSDTVAIHLKVSGGRGHRCDWKWDEEHANAEEDICGCEPYPVRACIAS